MKPAWDAGGMILACHTLIYSDDADATRASFKDVLGFASVDAGTGAVVRRANRVDFAAAG